MSGDSQRVSKEHPALGESDERARRYLADRLPPSVEMIDSILDVLEPNEMYEYAEKLFTLRIALATVRQEFADQGPTSMPPDTVTAAHDLVDRFAPLLTEMGQVAGVSERRSQLALLNLRVLESEELVLAVVKDKITSRSPGSAFQELTNQARQLVLDRQCQHVDETLGRVEQVLSSYRGDAEIRGANFRKQLSQQRRQSQALIDGLNQADAERVADLEIKLREVNENFQETLAKVERLLGEVAVSGVAHGHAASEARERTFANRWRLAAVGFALTALVLIALTTWLLDGLSSTQWVVLHLGLILSLGGLAAYAGRQSAEHRREERWARDSRLRLAAVTIWLEDLPDEVRRNLKSDLIQPFFLSTPYERKDVNRDASSPMLNSEVMALITRLLTTEFAAEPVQPKSKPAKKGKDTNVKP